MTNEKAELHNLKLEPIEFTLTFYTDNDEVLEEKDQTFETMKETIDKYKSKYSLRSVELRRRDGITTVMIELAVYIPF